MKWAISVPKQSRFFLQVGVGAMTWCEIVGMMLGSNSEKNHNSLKMVHIISA